MEGHKPRVFDRCICRQQAIRVSSEADFSPAFAGALKVEVRVTGKRHLLYEMSPPVKLWMALSERL